MNIFRADLHTHTILSPCGDLEMSPKNIIKKAKKQKIKILGITDHNSTLQAPLIKEIAKKEGIMVLMGVEVTTKEEIHCLCFFEEINQLSDFQTYIDENLPKIPNDKNKIGSQIIVNEQEEIIKEVEFMLLSSLKKGIDQIEKKVHKLNGLFIPAHINKMRNSIISQLGFIPDDLNVDALEISAHTTKNEFVKNNKYLKKYNFIQSSDAHYISDIGKTFTEFHIKNLSFSEIKKALKKEKGRNLKIY